MIISQNFSSKINGIFLKTLSIGKKQPYIFKKSGLKFYIRKNTTDRLVVMEVFNFNMYNLEEQKPKYILDIGANIGAFSLFAARKFPGAQIFAFEPESTNYAQLIKNTKLNDAKNIHEFKLGIADKCKNFKIYIETDNNSASSMYSSAESKNKKSVISQNIKCIDLKKLFKITKQQNFDLVKIDVEGAEYKIILTSTKQTLRRFKTIIMEFHDYLKLGPTHKDIIRHLEKCGFKVTLKNPIRNALMNEGIIHAERR